MFYVCFMTTQKASKLDEEIFGKHVSLVSRSINEQFQVQCCEALTQAKKLQWLQIDDPN